MIRLAILLNIITILVVFAAVRYMVRLVSNKQKKTDQKDTVTALFSDILSIPQSYMRGKFSTSLNKSSLNDDDYLQVEGVGYREISSLESQAEPYLVPETVQLEKPRP